MRTRPLQEGSAASPSKLAASGPDASRRRFLLTLGAGGAGAAGVVAGALPAAAAPGGGAEITTSGNGYRETAHVRDYYRSAKL